MNHTNTSGKTNGFKPPTQCERVLARLQEGPLNPLQSWQELGVYRLAPRCEELRKAGFDIRTRRIEVRNRFGEVCRVAEYHLYQDGENTDGTEERA